MYLFERGTIHPFAPTGTQRRDSAFELQVRTALSGELPIESDIERRFPIWNAPVP
ncbi:PspA-associated protein PspAB [Nocardia gipuzkoensis]|uniref:PspA-associated protein PspAB n=1 Tax=Nocardia gipuzkoensis TaxID=2749991 RepID=UPI0038CD7D60